MRKYLISFLIGLTTLLISNIGSCQTVLATYPIYDHASGLAFDGRNIWFGRYGSGGSKIYRFDTFTQQITDSLDLGSSNLDYAYGLTWDGQFLWVISHVGSDFTIKFDTLGNIISTFTNPSDYMSGLAWNGSSLYMGDYYNPDGAIYKVTTGGVVLENFPAPDTQPWDLAWDGTFLLMCDFWSDQIYMIDPITHQSVYSFPTPMEEPGGIEWDGTYLWLCDEGEGSASDNLYKISLFGGGIPQISLSTDTLDFGYTPINIVSLLVLSISNIGTSELTIQSMNINQIGSDFWVDSSLIFPFAIDTNATFDINIHYGPQNFGSSSGILNILSNDPFYPNKSVALLGEGYYPQQHIEVSDTLVDFGLVWVSQPDGITTLPFSIYNLGAQPLNLLSVNFDNSAFSQTGFESGALASLDTTNFVLCFSPTQTGLITGIMTIFSDDPEQPQLQITLQGTGYTANFHLGDIIWNYDPPQTTVPIGFNSVKSMSDINGDNVKEVIGANENCMIYCFNGQGYDSALTLWSFSTGWDPLDSGCVENVNGLVSTPDLDADGIGDLAFGTGGINRSVYALSGVDGEQIWRFDTHAYGGQGGTVYEVTCEDDWNGDNVWDILTAVGGPSGSSQPKSVFLLNGINGDVIWRSLLGEIVTCVRRLDDVNGDSLAEVVCASEVMAQVFNVRRLNGANGVVEWMTQINGNIYSISRIEDINSDEITDVIVAAGSAGVYALSGANGDVIWHITGIGFYLYQALTPDINGSGYDDILTISTDHNIYALEGFNGNTIWNQSFSNQNLSSVASTPDINGDNIFDAVCGSGLGSFYILSGYNGSSLYVHHYGSNLNYSFDAVSWLEDVDNSGGIELLGGTKDGCLFCYSGGNYILPSPTVEIVIEPVNPPIIIPPQGGTLQYQALVVNAWFTSTFFDYWTMLTLPDSSEYGPLFLRFNINLLPGGSIIRTFSQTVPGSAPFGDYVFTAYVGDYQSYSIWDEDAFSFSKSGVDDSGIENWIASGWEEEEDAINESSALETYFLYPPTPNPFNNITEITYFLPEAGEISLVVYNALGQEVATLDSGWKSAGFYTVIFNGDNLASGLYLCSMKDKNSSQVRKILLLK